VDDRRSLEARRCPGWKTVLMTEPQPPDAEGPMFDAFAEDYLEHARDSAYNAHYDRPAVMAMVGAVGGLRVLDVGCGPGLYAGEFVARGARFVLGIDASAEMVRLASERVRGPVEFRRHDLAEPLDWLDDGAFDLAVMALVLHHVEDRRSALLEIARVLRPGGRLVVSTHHPTSDWLRQGGSYFTVARVTERWSRGWLVSYWRQPLEATCAEFTDAGFLIEALREPTPSQAFRQRDPDAAERLSVEPGFIVFGLVKR
jgi:ubiquinone/menaquinone biosynthesis C-methylase UbiE